MSVPAELDGDADRVQPEVLVLSILLVPVLVIAFIMLYVFPESIGLENFAWPVTPQMTSMMLGATYLGGAYFFLVVLLSRRWRHVRLGFLPIAAFAGTLAIATLLHWDRFNHERIVFLFWAVLYFTVPFIVPFLWYRNQRLAGEANGEQDRRINPASRWAFGILGAILTIAGLMLLLFPELMQATWPWTLTALTARVMAAIYILPGLVGLSMALDGRWSSARYLLQVMGFTIVLMLMALFVARGELDWGRPVSWIFTAGLVVVLFLIVYTILSMRERSL
jgi:hypothetical protein